MPLYLTIACLLLSYMYECSLVNLLMEEIKIKKIFCFNILMLIFLICSDKMGNISLIIRGLYCSPQIVSEYDQEILQSQTADNPMAPRGRAPQPYRDTRKTN